MKKRLRLFAGLVAALMAMTCMSAAASADSIRKSGGVYYRYSDSGSLVGKYTGWAKTTKGKLYIKNGARVKNKWLRTRSGKYYYAGRDGYMRTGWTMVTLGDGLYSYFNSKGVWDGKTYWTGYNVPDLQTVFKDVDFLSGNTFYYQYNYHSDKNMKKFDGADVLNEILLQDLKTPLLWSDRSDDEIEAPDGLYLGGTKIVIRSSVSNTIDLEFTKDKYGNSYLYNAWYGFGMTLSERDAFDMLVDAIGYLDESDPDDYEQDEYDDPEPLDDEQREKLFSDFIKYKAGKGGWSGYTADDLTLRSYFGTYHGCEAVIIYCDEKEVTDDMVEYNIGGFTIELSSGSYELLLHRNGTFMKVDDAYKDGILTDEDIKMIAYYAS